MNKKNSDSRFVKEMDIIQVKNGVRLQKKDQVIKENILKVFINGKEYFKMVFTPKYPKELAAGYLFTQGIVQNRDDIESIEWNDERQECRLIIKEENLKRLTFFEKERKTKGSSGGMVILQQDTIAVSKNNNDNFTVTSEEVLSFIKAHYEHSELFIRTGAVHSCGICDKNGLLYYYEDIGRHNAVDKMAGDILLRQIDISNKIVTLSCRMSLEIVEKVIIAGVKIIISNAAPTMSALKLAEKAGLTVIGFARDNRFNIYTHDRRVE